MRRQTHEMVLRRDGLGWVCRAAAPPCGFATDDLLVMVAHATSKQQDLRHLPPLDWPGPEERVA